MCVYILYMTWMYVCTCTVSSCVHPVPGTEFHFEFLKTLCVLLIYLCYFILKYIYNIYIFIWSQTWIKSSQSDVMYCYIIYTTGTSTIIGRNLDIRSNDQFRLWLEQIRDVVYQNQRRCNIYAWRHHPWSTRVHAGRGRQCRSYQTNRWIAL